MDGTYCINYIIVKNNQGTKVLRLARKIGLQSGTIMLGRGTLTNSFLQKIGLGSIEKEIVIIIGENQKSAQFLKMFNERFNFSKENTGICFNIPVLNVYGTSVKLTAGCKNYCTMD